MREAVASMDALVAEWSITGSIAEIEWNRIVRSLEFQEILSARDARARTVDQKACLTCPDFDEHVRRSYFHMMTCAVLMIYVVSGHALAEGAATTDQRAQGCAF